MNKIKKKSSMYSMFSNSNIHKIPFKFRTPEIIKKAKNIYTVEIELRHVPIPSGGNLTPCHHRALV